MEKQEHTSARIMYIEHKPDAIGGAARIGRVTFSKSGSTIYYGSKTLKSLYGVGFKANYYDVETNEEYWVSGCKKRGGDRLYPGVIEIDEDVREEYWTQIRNLPDRKDESMIRCTGKYGGKQGRKH